MEQDRDFVRKSCRHKIGFAISIKVDHYYRPRLLSDSKELLRLKGAITIAQKNRDVVCPECCNNVGDTISI